VIAAHTAQAFQNAASAAAARSPIRFDQPN
jgi:hypothetical protein